jgi:hypothetical protein
MVRHHPVTRSLLLPACLALCCAAPAGAADPRPHGHSHGRVEAPEEANLPPAPGGLTSVLEDDVRAAGPGLVSWSTYWQLCWQPVAGALFYELRLTTSEGAPRTPRRLAERCYRLEVAAGENPAADGMPRRQLMLDMQAAQASVQVRAVFEDGRRTAWTGEQAVGALR